MEDSYFCAIGFSSRVKLAFLQIYLFVFRKKAFIYNSYLTDKGAIHPWFVKKGKLIFNRRGIGEIKGLYYGINEKAIELTETYFNRYIGNAYFLRFMNRFMKTGKCSCYIKKQLVNDFYEVLSSLALVQAFSKSKNILMMDTPPNRFVLSELFKEKHLVLEIYWIHFRFLFWLIPISYYLYLLKKLSANGLAYHNRMGIKVYKEAVWGLSRPMLRDDVIIDNEHFKKEDILFYSRFSGEGRGRAVEQVQRAGYSVVDLRKCKLNLREGLFPFIRIFLLQPAWLCVVLMFKRLGYLIESVILFYTDSLHHFLFLTNYRSRCHLSISDHGEIAETIMMNWFDCKNVIYHWSDMTAIKSVSHAFTAHNVYYTWGPIHHDFEKAYQFFDKVEVVGCIFLKTYFEELEKQKEKEKEREGRRKILICDDSFGNAIYQSENVYLDGLDLVIEMSREIPDAEFIFKAKNTREGILDSFTDEKRRNSYLEKMMILNGEGKFTYHENTVQLETLIPFSDIVVNIGMSSPALIALIVGKEAVYYDQTGNEMHPLSQYRDKVFFNDKRMLIEYVKDVLDNKKSVFDDIDPDLLKKYEPFRDSKALERLISAISKEIGNG